MIFLPYLNVGRKIKTKVSESKNRDEQHLNGNLTMLETQIHSEKPWFSKLTSQEMVLDL